jgi:hypothetical protein
MGVSGDRVGRANGMNISVSAATLGCGLPCSLGVLRDFGECGGALNRRKTPYHDGLFPEY